MGVGEDEDRGAWFAFLQQANGLLAELGDIPFIHYAPCERTWVRQYVERWGGPDSVARRAQELLLDPCGRTILKACCFPLPSYGLKHIEQETGFRRSQSGYPSRTDVLSAWGWRPYDVVVDGRLGTDVPGWPGGVQIPLPPPAAGAYLPSLTTVSEQGGSSSAIVFPMVTSASAGCTVRAAALSLVTS